MPFLGGVTRDYLPSERSLYTLLYMLLPPLAAYVTGYILQILTGLCSFALLLEDVLGAERYRAAEPIIMLLGLTYGSLHLFPAFGLCFSSIPLIVLILRRIYLRGKKLRAGDGTRTWLMATGPWLIAAFLYPFVSYFSYFGFFILAYLTVAIILLWIRDRRISVSLLTALLVLAAGYVFCEYRLFSTMLFDDTVTIRSSMADTDLGLADALMQGLHILTATPVMHVEDVHQYLIMPVCAIYLVILNAGYIRRGDLRGMVRDPYNLLALLLLFNCSVYALYFCGLFRRGLWRLIPQLTGFQFNRTYFFNPLIWLLMLFIVCYRVGLSPDNRLHKAGAVLAYAISAAAFILVLFMPTTYNDVYHTAHDMAVRLIRGWEPEALSYDEFYSEELFNKALSDIGYDGEWSAAYGLHPAVLEYNGISTLDGYLGFYPQEYKERFRQVIAPALDRMPQTAAYYDDWGARCYLYSGTDETIVQALRHPAAADTRIYIDSAALYELGGRYIFSRIELSFLQMFMMSYRMS